MSINQGNKIENQVSSPEDGNIFFIHGGGNIGLGLMAAIVSNSTYPYKEIVATSSNKFNCKLINASKKLWLQHPNNETTCVENVRMVSREQKSITKLYTEANIVAICLTAGAMEDVARDVAVGLINRYKVNSAELNILVLMNAPDCDKYVCKIITQAIASITEDNEITNNILSKITFTPTVIDRIVTPISQEEVIEQIREQLVKLNQFDDNQPLSDLHVLIKLVKEFNLQFKLFNAEKNFSMHVPDTFKEAKYFPLLTVTKNLHQIEVIKNKYINGSHAILAWIGALSGYRTIAEAIKDPDIFNFIRMMMKYEIAPTLMNIYPELAKKTMTSLKSLFFARCVASEHDLIPRVGRDPLRKLNAGERIRGTIELIQKYHIDINTPRLEVGIAAAFLYALTGQDSTNLDCKKMNHIYKESNNSYTDLFCYNGSSPSGFFIGLDPNIDSNLIHRILYHITFMHKQYEKQAPLSSSRPPNSSTMWERKSSIPKSLSSSIPIDFFYERNQKNGRNVISKNKYLQIEEVEVDCQESSEIIPNEKPIARSC